MSNINISSEASNVYDSHPDSFPSKPVPMVNLSSIGGKKRKKEKGYSFKERQDHICSVSLMCVYDMLVKKCQALSTYHVGVTI